MVEAYERAKREAPEVKVWPKTYHGKIPIDRSKATRRIETNWLRKKSEANRQLQVIASFHGFELVFETDYDTDHDSEGNYEFTTWKAHATAAHKR